MRQTTIVAVLDAPPRSTGIPDAVRAARWLEVRGDTAGDIDAEWLRGHFAGTLLYSLRARGPDRTARLLRAAKTYDLIDLEPGDLTTPELLAAIPPQRRVITATHLTTTPALLHRIELPADESGDELAAPRLLKTLGRTDVTAWATGPVGLWTRLLAPWLGARVVFGGANGDDAAQGLPSVTRLVENFGFPDLPDVQELFGMAGDPVLHSLSPKLHNTTYRSLGRAALYLPFHVRDFEKFWTRVAGSGALDALGFPLRGLSIVSPHKSAAINVTRHSSDIVQHALSTNLVRRNGGDDWYAETTDAQGIMITLRDRGVQPRGRRAAVIGCGGSGRAMAAALDAAGADVTLVNRGPERGSLAVNLLHLPFVPLSDFSCDGYSIVVNATPVGRNGDHLPFPVHQLRRDAVVVDLVYRDGPTPLIERTRGPGRITIDGWDMLMAQARHQFALMTGEEMPDELIRQTLGLDEWMTGKPACRRAAEPAPPDRQDRLSSTPNEDLMTKRIEIEPMAGRWLKTNDKPQWIGSADVGVEGDRLRVRLYGGGLGPTPADWGESLSEVVYASRIDTTDAHAGAFVCNYAFTDFDVEVQANLNLGLLVIATYVTFREPGPYANRFTREFFRREEAAA